MGLIDFDLMAAGDPAVDVANFICHLELREQQGGAAAAPLVAAFLDGYQPSRAVRQALPFYLATSARRLTAVYAFREGPQGQPTDVGPFERIDTWQPSATSLHPPRAG